MGRTRFCFKVTLDLQGSDPNDARAFVDNAIYVPSFMRLALIVFKLSKDPDF